MQHDPSFQQILSQIAEDKGVSLEKVQEEAARYWEELQTQHDPTWELVAVEIVEYLLGRGYDKTIDVEYSELRELTRLMRRHPVAFVMTHKTYIDMLVLGIVLARHGLPLPHIFAGINMDFMGLSQIGRKVGAIFIRRNIGDNEVYKATLRQFIASKLLEKGSFMWALEGTRSRTGKLVWPKMGILKYIREAEVASGIEVKYVPVSIVYDLIPDVAEMMEEGRGTVKTPESLLWFIQYLRDLGQDFGRIAIRFGEAVDVSDPIMATLPDEEEETAPATASNISRFAFEIMHRINRITPVTTGSLICVSLLSKFANSRPGIESDTVHLMSLIENHQPDALVDRGKPIGDSVQHALKLMTRAGLFLQQGQGLNARHVISTEQYLAANYYANMAAHHFYHRAFIELASTSVMNTPVEKRKLSFWVTIMALRDLFKFEFFYSAKSVFTDEIERDLTFMYPDWERSLFAEEPAILPLLASQEVLVAPVVLYNYVEAYRVVAHGLQQWDVNEPFTEEAFLNFCMALGEEMRWLGRIRRIEAVSKPFLQNGIRLAANRKLIPGTGANRKAIAAFAAELDQIAAHINTLQEITLQKPVPRKAKVPVEKAIIPGSRTEAIVAEIMADAEGPQIGLLRLGSHVDTGLLR
ncbi:MAG: 1-acyl-sn-glycerol-3-phosphate acyltransferase [Saprospiraceae bacterium]